MNHDREYYARLIRSSLVREFLGGVKAVDSYALQEAFAGLTMLNIDPIDVFDQELDKLKVKDNV